jgi:hypothetical protein
MPRWTTVSAFLCVLLGFEKCGGLAPTLRYVTIKDWV